MKGEIQVGICNINLKGRNSLCLLCSCKTKATILMKSKPKYKINNTYMNIINLNAKSYFAKLTHTCCA